MGRRREKLEAEAADIENQIIDHRADMEYSEEMLWQAEEDLRAVQDELRDLADEEE